MAKAIIEMHVEDEYLNGRLTEPRGLLEALMPFGEDIDIEIEEDDDA